MEAITKKRKRKAILDLNEFIDARPFEVMKEKLKQVFKKHIGQENSVNKEELFLAIYNVKASEVDVYKRQFLWGIIEMAIKRMRHLGELFIIKKDNKYFILKTEEEEKYYKGILTKGIENYKLSIDKAHQWVIEEKWKKL